MKRHTFIKKTGSVLKAPLDAWSCIKNQGETAISPATANSSGTCKITDTEELGPFPLYDKRGSEIVQTDITEGKSEMPLKVSITIRNVNDNCAVVPNASVFIWHCDKDGYYSGYVNQGYLGNQDNTASDLATVTANAALSGYDFAHSINIAI